MDSIVAPRSGIRNLIATSRPHRSMRQGYRQTSGQANSPETGYLHSSLSTLLPIRLRDMRRGEGSRFYKRPPCIDRAAGTPAFYSDYFDLGAGGGLRIAAPGQIALSRQPRPGCDMAPASGAVAWPGSRYPRWNPEHDYCSAVEIILTVPCTVKSRQ